MPQDRAASFRWDGTTPLTATQEAFFWARVEKHADGHWAWTGDCSGRNLNGIMDLGGRKVLAGRVAWALMKGCPVPKRLERVCNFEQCINPDHRAGVIARPMMAVQEEVQVKRARAAAAERPYTPDHEEIVIPPALQALGALQFGLPVTPQRLHFTGRAVETVQPPTAVEPVEVKAPLGTAVVNPTEADMQHAAASVWNDPEKLLELIFTPGTCVMTFQDHVWFWNNKVRVDAPDGPRALAAALALMAERRNHG